MSSEQHWIYQVAEWLKLEQPDSALEIDVRQAISDSNLLELESLLGVLDGSSGLLSAHPARTRMLCQLIAAQGIAQNEADPDTNIEPDLIANLYDHLHTIDGHSAAHMLQILAASKNVASLEKLADLMIEAPPAQWQAVGLGLSPLWHADAPELENFFDFVSDALMHPSTMAVLLDLANFSSREQKLTSHPWSNKADQLSSLLTEVVKQLQLLEEDPNKFGDSVEEVQHRLNESVALTISLCDSLGLIQDPDCKDCLLGAMALKHRRIQTEAAGALARIGVAEGKQRILELANDRAARMRAVFYAEELGCVDEIPAELRAPQALAESELAGWLAAPEQFGFGPNEMELIDSTTQYWPGYDEPQTCYLFRFNYSFPQGSISNIGIAGPLTQAFSADLANLPVADIYAAFAGWQAEHEEIFEVPITGLNPAQRREADRLEETLALQGLEIEKPVALTFFFGEVALLAEVQQDSKSLCAVTDGEETLCFPTHEGPTALTPDVILCIYRGRKLLRTFNN